MSKIAKFLPAAVLVSLICLACPVQAKDYFVEQKNAVADDKNPGTEAKPFKTIQPAVDAAKPGDTVYVKTGLYQDPVNIRTSGTPNSPATLTAWKDDRVVVGSEPIDLPPADSVEGHRRPQELSGAVAARNAQGRDRDPGRQGHRDGGQGRPAQRRRPELGDVPRERPHADAQHRRRQPGRHAQTSAGCAISSRSPFG